MVNEVKFTLAMDGGTAVVTDLDQVGRKLVDVNTKVKDVASGMSEFNGSMLSVGRQLKGFGDAQASAALAAVDASNKVGMSARAMSAALRGVPAQFTDIVVSLQSGQAPLTVLMQQGGQLKDMFGGVGNAAKALGGYMLSLINVYSVTAAAVGVLGYAYMQGAKEAHEYSKSLTLTGNAAGTTVGQLQGMAAKISQATGATQGAAAEALTAFANSSNIASASFEQFAGVALKAQKETGVAVTETAAKFSDLGKSPLESSIKLNDSMHYLTASVYEQIKALEEHGNKAGAAAIAQKAYSDALDSSMRSLSSNLGTVEKAWRDISGVAKGAWDAMLGIGRQDSIADKIEKVQQKIAAAQVKAGDSMFPGLKTYGASERDKALLPELQEQLRYFTLIKSSQDELARGDAKRAALQIDLQNFDARSIEMLTKKGRLDRELAVAQVEGDRLVAAGLKTQVDLNKQLADIREKYKDSAKTKSEADKGLATYNDLIAKSAGLNANFTEEWNKLTAAQKAGKISIDQLTVAQAQLLSEQTFSKDAAKEAADTAKDQEKAITALLEAGQKELDQIDAKIKKQIETNEQIGLTKDQVFSLNAARQMQSALADEEYAQAIRNAAVYAGEYKDAYLQYANALDLAAEERRKLAGLDAVGASKKAANEAFKEWEKTADKINDALTDALMRGFESGKGFAESLRDSVVSVFKSMAAIKIRAIVEPVGQAAAGLLGFGGAANAGNTVSGLSNLASIGGAGFQAITGSLAGASAASLGYANAVGAVGGDAIGGLIAANGGWAGVSTMATAGEVGALGTAAGAGAGAAGSITSALASIGPVGWAAIAAGAVLALQDHGKPTSNTGNAAANYDSAGNRTGYEVFGGSSEPVDRMLANLQDTYTKAAQALGIGAAATRFTFGGNTGKNGESPNFALGGQAGGKEFYQAETTSSDAAISLAASRAVFAALQGSDLPVYLAKMFDGLSASAMSQDQITNTLAYAQSVKQVRDALLETREPLQILKDNVARGFVALGTSAERFKVDFVSAIDNGISPDKLAQWQSLQTAMTDLATASGKASDAVKSASRSIADIANERTRLQDRLDELTLTSAQLLDKQRNAIDDSNRSLFDQVTAQESLKAATDSAASAAEAMAQRVGGALASLADARASLQSQLLAAQGDSIGALALTRKTELAKLTDGLSSTDAESVTAAYAYNTALEDQIKALNDAKAAAEAAASAQARAASEAQSAADRISSAWQSITDSIFSEVQRIRGLMGGGGAQSYAQAQAKFSITTAQARAGDQDAARLLPALSQTLLTLAESNATSLTELRRIQGQTSSSLDLTGRGFASQYGLSIPKLDTGTNMVPQDMLALIHKGEAVIPKAYNPVKANGQSNAELLAELRELRALLAQIRDSSKDTASSTRAAEKTLVAVTEGGTGMLIAANSEIPVTVLM